MEIIYSDVLFSEQLEEGEVIFGVIVSEVEVRGRYIKVYNLPLKAITPFRITIPFEKIK